MNIAIYWEVKQKNNQTIDTLIYYSNYCNITGKEVYDEDGELVCLKPFPSMPVYFWNDPQGLKYKKAYFSVYNGKCTFSRFVK